MIDWSLFNGYWGDLLSGVRVTVELWLAGSAVALLMGFGGSLLLTGGPAPLRPVVRCYVELFRGTPLLVQLFLIYAGGPQIGITLSAITVGVCGLGLYGGAYATEIFRAGFAAIPPGQVEAARCFGYSRTQIVCWIVLPQALLLSLPALVNLLIFILKDTAILSILTIPELTFQVTGMTLETFAFVEPYMALALLYWLLVELASRAGHLAEHGLRRRLGLLAA
jgi:polar amino acid transport system permease protein